MSLEQGRKKKRGKANPILCHLASSTSVQRRFQQDPPFLHLVLKEALCQVVCTGWGRGVVEGRGEKKEKKTSPHSCICSNLEWIFYASILGAVQKRLEKKILRAGLLFERERHCHPGCCPWWTLEAKGQRSLHRNQSSNEKKPGKYIHRGDSWNFFFLKHGWGKITWDDQILQANYSYTFPSALERKKHIYISNFKDNWLNYCFNAF